MYLWYMYMIRTYLHIYLFYDTSSILGIIATQQVCVHNPIRLYTYLEIPLVSTYVNVLTASYNSGYVNYVNKTLLTLLRVLQWRLNLVKAAALHLLSQPTRDSRG